MALLVVAVFVIWGTVLYRVTTTMKPASPGVSGATSGSTTSPGSTAPTSRHVESYEGGFRDPFRPSLGQLGSSSKQEDSSENPSPGPEEDRPAPAPIPLRLVGIVEQTALIQLPEQGGSTRLVSEGDTVSIQRGPVVVRDLDPGRVIIALGNRADTLRLPSPELASGDRPDE